MKEPLRLHGLPGFWLRCLHSALTNKLQARLKSRDAGVAVSEWVTLSILHERPGLSINELAHLAGMHQAPISRIVDKLTKKKLVTRVTSMTDRRSVKVELTAEGVALREGLLGVAADNARESFSCLTEEEFETFMHTLQKVLKHNNFDKADF